MGTLLMDILKPIIIEAVGQALSSYLPQSVPPQPSFPKLMDIKMIAEFLHLSVPIIYGLVHI